MPGRFQVLPGRPQVILDVAHNPQAARALAANLGDEGFAPETIAVFGMLRDKDIAGVVRARGAARSRAGIWRRCRDRAARARTSSLRILGKENITARATKHRPSRGARRGEERSGRE